jgi:hypothetical protein
MHKMHKQRGISWCLHLLHEIFDIELKAWKQWPTGEQPNWDEGPRCTWCHGLLFHIHPWLLLRIGVGKNVLQRHHKIEDKVQLVNWYNISPMAMGQTPHEGLVMVKRRTTLRICAIQCGMWPCVIWEQSWNIYGNPFVKSYRW